MQSNEIILFLFTYSPSEIPEVKELITSIGYIFS
jgi:hypothetical protein